MPDILVNSFYSLICDYFAPLQVRKNINFVWLPVTVTGIFAYLIAGCFMSVYEVGYHFETFHK